jgi:lipoprotein-releasing system ATP-binding protein
MIKANNIHKYYEDLHVLKGINLSVKKSEIISIVGASGAGKTTFLQILGTLDRPSKKEKSSLTINNIDVGVLTEKEMAKFRNENLGFIFQFHQLLPEFSALENVCIPAYIKGTPKQKAITKAKTLLDFLGLSHRLNHKPNELSGGEQQRVAVARALINDPLVVLADEPSGNLDSTSAEQLHGLFFKLRDTFGYTFILVTHNTKLASMADRKITITDGQVLS